MKINLTEYWQRILLGLALAACAPAHAQDEKLAANTPRATSAGATFMAPAGWTLAQNANVVVLTPPEDDSKLALVDVEAKDADGAVAAAWAAFRPGFNRPLELATQQAAREGWAERRIYNYETSPNEKRVVFAIAFKAGAAWTVVLEDSSWATREKRGALFGQVIASLRPKGYERENFAAKKAHPLDARRIAVMREFVASSMNALQVPGVGFSLIDQGKVVFEGGLGVKELGKADKIDADTLFIAASNTKALTTLLLAELVDEKKLRWDEPVIEVMPAFKLGNADTTRKVLVKHLVCACTGLPRQDMEWLLEYRRSTPASTLALLGSMQPTSGFGEVYQYSNTMATAAGYVGAHVIAPGREPGRAYDEAMRARIFGPLHMRNSTFDFAQAQKGNHARPHGYNADAVQLMGRMDINYSIVPMRPAGGLWTSAHDLSKYVEMELARGVLPDGTRLVSEENLLARSAPQVLAGEDQSYGMGLFIDKKLGVTIVTHGGSMPGYRSNMLWLPEHGVGAVILTNSASGGSLLGPFTRKLMEVLFDARPEADTIVKVAAEQTRAWFAKERERLVIPADPAEAKKLAPRYTNPSVGDLVVRRKGDTVVFDFGEWSSTVASRLNDDKTISFITIDPLVGGFNLVVGEHQGKRALILRDSQHEYPFVERPAK